MQKQEVKPKHRFNNGKGATLCIKCSVIISNGLLDVLYCKDCWQKTPPEQRLVIAVK